MSEIALNSTYAPGIATYGAQGKQGKSGLPGYALYYLHQDIDLSSNKNDNYYNYVCNCIRNNIFITNNSNISSELLSMKNRTYQVGDMFLTPSGQIFILKDIENNGDIVFDIHGELISHDDLFDVDNSTNLIYNKNGHNVLLTDGSILIDEDNNINNSVLNIKTTNENTNAISFISNDNIVSFKHNNGSLLIDSSGNTLFNNVYVDYDINATDSVENNKHQYHKIRTFKDFNISDFYTYNDEDDKLSIIPAAIGTDFDYFEILAIDNNNKINRTYIFKDDEDKIINLSEYRLVEILVPTVDYITKTIKIK